MSDDLVKRLRYEANTDGFDFHGDLHEQAADCIAALTARVTELEGQLQDMSLFAMEATIETTQEEIRAEAALVTSRDDALEEAAQWHDERAADEMALSSKYRGGSNPWFAHIQKADAHEKSAREIRALRGTTDGAGE